MWREVAFGGTALLFLAKTASALGHLRWARRLPALRSPAEGEVAARPPRCSVIVPARDEGSRLEGTISRLLAQHGVDVEVIVVDNRSTDGTGDLLRRLAATDPRLRMLRVDILPDGWLGKCHACHVGAAAATGDWILFTDADCWLRQDVLARALQAAAANTADHIALTPGIAGPSLGAQAWHLAFLTSVSGWMAGVNRDRRGAYFGMGAFNLLTAAAYRECGGYEALRLTVVDDLKLGLLLHRAGKRTRAYIGGDDVECHWGTTVSGMFAVMEKNYFAAADFRILPPIVLAVIAPIMVGSPILGAWSGSRLGILAAISPLTLSLPALALARQLRWPARVAALAPLIQPLLVLAFLNSAWVTLRRGGIRWRDTFYPLDALRKGGVR